ncbi:MAG TPA: glycoside hydrolase family 76 protein [Acidobacteriaceae bacterium]|nr:glycoside hydrolase family 76 protein [Acidobacteriaceae bacterium]
MPARYSFASCRTHGVISIFTFLLTFLAAVPSTFAQWTPADAQTAFSDYNDAFYFNPSGDNYDYRSSQGATSTSGFWVGAEEIELAIDAYNQNPTAANQTVINQLCNGFSAEYTGNWSSDSYDDDLMWATIAFTRAAKATGNSVWLDDAETNFATVWSRGYDTTFGGGIWWNSAVENTASGYKNSAANWTFVIAGNLLYQATGDSTYQSEAATIFGWASSNLYNASTGEIYDGINGSGVQNGQYSYNYGVAIGADTFENQATDAANVANYLMNNVSGGTVNGYNILPNYGQGGTDGSGFNGITLRWVGYAWASGALTNPAILSWAQTNVGLAWAVRNASGLSWNDWFAFTRSGGLYSWDCSDTLAGMLDIPAPTAGSSGFALAASPATIGITPGSEGTSMISVTPAGGFTGTVALSLTVIGAPAGITASLSQTSVSGAANVTLTVDAASTTQGGNYLAAVTGSSGSVAQTVYVEVGLPYFTLSIAPSTISLNQSASASAAISITPQNGFHDKVRFSLSSGLPDGVNAWFQPYAATSSTALWLAALSNAFTTPNTPVSILGSSSNYTQTISTNLSVSAATGNSGTGVPVNLSSASNETGIYPTGATYSTGGLDGLGYSYSSNLLGASRVLSGVAFQFGPAGAPDAVYGTSQTIPLPPGGFPALRLLATGIGGEQFAQPLVVTYTDGSTSQYSQSFSDWFTPSFNPNESEAVAMPYRNAAGGTQDNAQFNLYGYTLLLNSSKIVKSLTLPSNRDVVLLAATLSGGNLGQPVSLASAFDAAGIYTDGSTFGSDGGLDGGGTAYSANLLGDSSGASTLVVNGDQFILAAPNANNVIYGAGTAIPLPARSFNGLHILGTGVEGAQTAQTVTVRYTDGSASTFTQSFSDWFSPQHFPHEAEGVQMAYRDVYNGTEGNGPLNLYEYSFPLNSNKVVQSLTLPANRHVLVLAVTLANDCPQP